MAPGTHARRQRDIASTLRPSVEVASDNAPPLSNNNNLSDNRESDNTDHEPDKTEDPQRRRVLFTPEPKPYDPETYGAWGRKHFGEEWYKYRNTMFREGKTDVLVSGKQMIIPQTYDPDTYDPDGRMPWTPEPEPYNPKAYTAWGRKHFGKEWYEQQKTMLQERNIYIDPDLVYKERQRALRVLEHKIEGRPFEPRGGVFNEDWKRLWARLSKDLPSAEQDNSGSPIPLHDSDGDLSGYDTYAPTPESREPTPLPDDPWERLEYNRRRFRWDEERYQFERIFCKEALIDGARRKREDEEGDRRRDKELEEIRKVQYLPGTLVQSGEYERRMRHFNLRREGWTQEQIDAEERAANTAWRESEKRRRREPVIRWNDDPRTQEEMDARFRAWDAVGVRREEQNHMARMYGFHERSTSADRDAENGVVLQSQASPPRPAKDTSHKTRSGQTTKNAPQRRSGSHRAIQSRQSTPTRAEALPPDQRRDPSKPEALEELGDNTQTAPQCCRRQRKTYEKERASRRLAGQLPEFGMLLGRGKTQPLLKASARQPSNPRKTGSSDPRNSRLSKKPTAAKAAKPQGILRSRRAGTGCPRRVT